MQRIHENAEQYSRLSRDSAGNDVERTVKKVRKPFDYSILVALIVLVCFGLVMVYSASYYTAENSTRVESSAYYFEKQLVGAGLGTFAMIFLMFFDYHKLIKFRYFFLIIAFGLLGAVFIPGIGQDINGSQRWINLFGFSIQPSEVAKFAIIIFIAAEFYKKPDRIRSFTRGLLPILALLIAMCGLIYFQPNYSAIICLAVLTFAMVIVGGANLKHIGVTGALGVAGMTGLLFTKSYRVDRLLAYMDPFSDPSDTGYQLVQSLYSIGSGGLFGRGLGQSKQKLLYLPYSESDFIFAIIAEELGFIGVLVLIAIFIFLIWRGVRVAMNAPDMMGLLLATGVVAIIAIQVIVNIGVVTGTIPPTGVVLPFISYGSSSLVIFMAMIGILLNVSRQGHK